MTLYNIDKEKEKQQFKNYALFNEQGEFICSIYSNDDKDYYSKIVPYFEEMAYLNNCGTYFIKTYSYNIEPAKKIRTKNKKLCDFITLCKNTKNDNYSFEGYYYLFEYLKENQIQVNKNNIDTIVNQYRETCIQNITNKQIIKSWDSKIFNSKRILYTKANHLRILTEEEYKEKYKIDNLENDKYILKKFKDFNNKNINYVQYIEH
ncbi:hypothetical protein Q5M87_04865 [Brachyspira innocens]|uniref:Uncharacterized protein n=1 Tax=Brachyspira innocens TaxID=13264 RepID=A0ABT8YVP0_9SPIR|nr:hypothetical protein [Brachyspira innocens]MDO6993336.1 hypothetical protein [Brachyspira innocens]MDO7019377.1 hypothetical protein [Brachyspira innocens]